MEGTLAKARLQILAKASTSSGWTVDISLDGTPLADNLPLLDPFDEMDEAEYRWYLEKYLSKSPFEISRADDVVETLVLRKELVRSIAASTDHHNCLSNFNLGGKAF